MNDQSFKLNILILKSNHIDYKENKYVTINVKNKLEEGSYGIVFMLENGHVIKFFKNSTSKNTLFEESNNLIPIKNENRELIFYYKYVNESKKEYNYIINLYAIGIIRNKIIYDDNKLDINSYFIILPYCIPFYKCYNIKNKPLIHNKNGLTFTIKVMKRLIEIIHFFETKYNLINLDLKLNNFMFTEKTRDLNNLIMLDFSIIKTKTKTKYDIENKYFIWPNINNTLIEIIPSYSTCINGLELLFGYDQIIKLPNNELINIYLKIIEKKNKNIYDIFYNGLILRINTDNFKKLLNAYVS